MNVRIYVLFYFVLTYLTSHSKYISGITLLLKDVKEAAYYDSVNLLKVGEDTIKLANISEKQKGAIEEVHLYYN